MASQIHFMSSSPHLQILKERILNINGTEVMELKAHGDAYNPQVQQYKTSIAGHMLVNLVLKSKEGMSMEPKVLGQNHIISP